MAGTCGRVAPVLRSPQAVSDEPSRAVARRQAGPLVGEPIWSLIRFSGVKRFHRINWRSGRTDIRSDSKRLEGGEPSAIRKSRSRTKKFKLELLNVYYQCECRDTNSGYALLFYINYARLLDDIGLRTEAVSLSETDRRFAMETGNVTPISSLRVRGTTSLRRRASDHALKPEIARLDRTGRRHRPTLRQTAILSTEV